MKRYTVIYDPNVERALAYLVVRHWDTPTAVRISLASNRIDKVLSMNPQHWGNMIRDNLRVLWVPPLEIMYVIFEEDRQVIVFDVQFVAEDR